jgi:hypothetical protein
LDHAAHLVGDQRALALAVVGRRLAPSAVVDREQGIEPDVVLRLADRAHHRPRQVPDQVLVHQRLAELLGRDRPQDRLHLAAQVAASNASHARPSAAMRRRILLALMIVPGDDTARNHADAPSVPQSHVHSLVNAVARRAWSASST